MRIRTWESLLKSEVCSNGCCHSFYIHCLQSCKCSRTRNQEVKQGSMFFKKFTVCSKIPIGADSLKLNYIKETSVTIVIQLEPFSGIITVRVRNFNVYFFNHLSIPNMLLHYLLAKFFREVKR